MIRVENCFFAALAVIHYTITLLNILGKVKTTKTEMNTLIHQECIKQIKCERHEDIVVLQKNSISNKCF